MLNIPWFTGFRVVQDFFHQQYHWNRTLTCQRNATDTLLYVKWNCFFFFKGLAACVIGPNIVGKFGPSMCWFLSPSIVSKITSKCLTCFSAFGSSRSVAFWLPSSSNFTCYTMPHAINNLNYSCFWHFCSSILMGKSPQKIYYIHPSRSHTLRTSQVAQRKEAVILR